MPTTELRFTGCNAADLRVICVMLSQHRAEIASHNHAGSVAPHWAPIVHAEGMGWTVITPHVPLEVAVRITSALSDPAVLAAHNDA